MGQRIFVLLKEKGYSIRCLLRKNSIEKKVAGAEIIRGNVWEKDSFKGALDGIDAVIHLVGIIQERKLHGNTFERVHYEGTRNLIEESKKAGIKKFVQMSALGTRPNAQSQYHKTKWRAEETVRNSGLPYTIFRPSLIFGELPCAFLQTLFSLAQIPIFTPIIGQGKTKLQPVYVGDVARCFEQARWDDKTNEKIFELGGTKSYSFLELMTLIEQKLGKKKFKLSLPIWQMKIAAYFMELMPFPTPLSRDQLTMLKEDNLCEPSAIRTHFNFPPTEFESWLDQLRI